MIMFIIVTTAAVAGVRVGSALLVNSTHQLKPDSGSRLTHFVLQKAVAVEVSSEN